MVYKIEEPLFHRLGEMDPAKVCRRAICTWNSERACFELEVWGHTYETYPKHYEILPRDPTSPAVNTALSLAIIYYLMGAKDLFLKKEWISEKDIPGGEQFFRGPHQIPSNLIATAFSEDFDSFKPRCEKLGGQKIEMADSGFAFRFLPRVQIAVALWKGDEEFDAQARLFFDRTISGHLPLDVIFAITHEICSRITKRVSDTL